MTSVDLNSNRCTKQTTIAIIEKDGNYWIGTNWCHTPQKECPRANMPSGIGYDKCRDICGQMGHAEENALRSAGTNASGATLYLIGHTRVCENCRSLMDMAGIKDTILVNNNRK